MPDDWMKIIHATNPYDGFPAEKFKVDMQGWGHDSPIFEHVIHTYRPSRMIEVGTWKGASAINTARLMKRYQIPDPQLLCVDTWLGSIENWLDPHGRERLGGRPFGDGTPTGPPLPAELVPADHTPLRV